MSDTASSLVAVACRAFDADSALLPALFRVRRPGRPSGSPARTVAA